MFTFDCINLGLSSSNLEVWLRISSNDREIEHVLPERTKMFEQNKIKINLWLQQLTNPLNLIRLVYKHTV